MQNSGNNLVLVRCSDRWENALRRLASQRPLNIIVMDNWKEFESRLSQYADCALFIDLPHVLPHEFETIAKCVSEFAGLVLGLGNSQIVDSRLQLVQAGLVDVICCTTETDRIGTITQMYFARNPSTMSLEQTIWRDLPWANAAILRD